MFAIFSFQQLSTFQDWCETPLKPENSKVYKAYKEAKDEASRQFLETTVVIDVLSGATCKMPAYLQINIKLRDSESRDQHLGQFFSKIEALGEKYQENTDNTGLFAIFSTEEQSLKRTRRAAAIVLIFFHFCSTTND